MAPKTLSVFFLLTGILASTAPAQPTYSDSSEYKPRQIDKPKKERKKKGDGREGSVIQPVAKVDGDVTVTIPVFVRDRTESPINDLTQKDFSVFVDGNEVPITAFERDKEPLNVILMMDSSPSAEVRFKAMQEQANKLINALPPDLRIVLTDFNAELNVRSRPTANRVELRAAMSKMEVGDGTSLYSAIHFLYETILPQIPGRKVILLMTDGVDTTSRRSTFDKSLTEVEKHDVTIYPIHVDTVNDNPRSTIRASDWIILGRRVPPAGHGDDDYERGRIYLQDLARASGGRVFSSKKLADETNSLLDELANRYYLMITVPRQNSGTRAVRVRVNRPSAAVSARGSFVEK